jgi:hypothetical protein
MGPSQPVATLLATARFTHDLCIYAIAGPTDSDQFTYYANDTDLAHTLGA